MILSTSMDTTLKVFITNTEIAKAELKFDKSDKDIKKLSILSSSKAASQAENSK